MRLSGIRPLYLLACGVAACAVAPSAYAWGVCRTVTAAEGFPTLPAPASPIPDLDPLFDLRQDMDLTAMPPEGDGRGVRVADIEYGWDALHRELARPGLSGPEVAPPAASWNSHGTAALSVIGAHAGNQGITGIAPAATLLPISPMRATIGWRPALAIAQAAEGLRAGDVMLIEQQENAGTASSPVFRPIYERNVDEDPRDEVQLTVADAIAAASAKGVVVVVPAGNGAANVGQELTPRPAAVADAIVVGAGLSDHADGVTAAAAPFSNHGDTVDVQGPGTGVVAAHSFPTMYGGLVGTEATAPRAGFTHCFNGTSSAAAVVAGGIASMQSVARERRGTPFSVAEVRARLKLTGTLQAFEGGAPTPGAPRVGPLPRFARAADLSPPVAASELTSEPRTPIPGQTVELRWASTIGDVGGNDRRDDVVYIDDVEIARVPAGVGLVRTTVPAGSTPRGWSVTVEDVLGNGVVSQATFTPPETPPVSTTRTVTTAPVEPAPPPVDTTPPPPPTPAPTPTPPPAQAVVVANPAGRPQASIVTPRAALLRAVSRRGPAGAVTVRLRLRPGAVVMVAGRRVTVGAAGIVRIPSPRRTRTLRMVVTAPQARTVVISVRVPPRGAARARVVVPAPSR